MQTLEAFEITHFVIEQNTALLVPIEKLPEFTKLLSGTVPVEYNWSRSTYVPRNANSRPEIKLLTLTDIAKITLEDTND